MTEKQEALKEMPDSSDIDAIGDWAFKHRNTIRAALTEVPKVDVDELRKESRDVVCGYIERTWCRAR